MSGLGNMFWYRFCIEQKSACRRRGEKTAAMVWWAMRWWDKIEPDQLITAEGFEERVSKYLDYKLATVPQEFDYVSRHTAAAVQAREERHMRRNRGKAERRKRRHR